MKNNICHSTRISHFDFKVHTNKSVLKKVYLFLLVMLLIAQIVYSQPADAGLDKVNVKRKGIQIGTPPITIGTSATIDPTWCYVWVSTPADPSLKNNKVAQPVVNPIQKTTYKLTLYNKDGNNVITQITSDEVDVYILDDVKFSESTSQKYGYDDGAYASGPTRGQIWKSVAVGQEDVVDMNITEPHSAKFVHLKSDNTNIATVQPIIATTSPQQLTIKGISKNNIPIYAVCENPAVDMNKLNVACYPAIRKTLAIRLVHEQNDDVQVIPKTQGSPNATAITAGPNGILESIPNLNRSFSHGAKDDLPLENTISTGADGVCETAVLGDDVPKIPPGQGEPNQVCITKGANNFLDSHASLRDHLNASGDIDTGADGICDTYAADADIFARDYSESLIESYLKDLYKQAAIDWQVMRLADMTVNADLNNNSNIDFLPKPSTEAQALIDKCKDDTYDYNLFFVIKVNYGSLGLRRGITSAIGGKYCFVDVSFSPSNSEPVEHTVAHELGHAFGLLHPISMTDCHGDAPEPKSNYEDRNNLMNYCGINKLRKFQWDIINP